MLINGERSLAYIAKITDIQPIPDADRIEVATINGGWKVVIAKKDDFQVEDEVIYIEIDSKVPEIPEFEFLKDRKYRVKTVKLRGQFSQGLVVPKSLFPIIKDKKLGEDVSKELNITYYVAEDNTRKASDKPNIDSVKSKHPWLFRQKWFRKFLYSDFGKKYLLGIFGKKDTKSGFPSHFMYVHKTDEERIENIPQVLTTNKNPFIVTEKLDGTSCTYVLERLKRNKFKFYVSSRNVLQRTPDQKCAHAKNIYWDMAFKYNIEEHMKDYLIANPDLDYICIQGEGVGSVQGNPLKLDEDALYVFNFIRSDIGRISSIDGKLIVESWGMNWVPILETEYYLPEDLEEFKIYADGKSVINPSVLREGLVLRDPKTDFSFKNVSRKYLAKKVE